MKKITLPAGVEVPALGLGTWMMGENARVRADELAALRLGLDLGATLIDTAEMYGEGKAEELVGEAIAGRRDEVFVVSKVYPHNATRLGTIAACERSLRRLRTDRLDLYLLHWRGAVPFAETVEAFTTLQRDGKIRHFGVSNLGVDDMVALRSVPSGCDVQTDQVLYNLGRRGIEWDLLPWLRARGVPLMAYSPIEQGRLLRDAKLEAFARRYGHTPAQVALAWLLRNDDVIVIPKASHRERVVENAGALEIRLDRSQLTELDAIFPPPQRACALEML